MMPIESISLDAIRAAQERMAGLIVRTPLLPLNVDDAPAEIYLKLENLQPIGSFKMRGTANAVLAADKEQLQKGVWTASAGNAAQGVAWAARRLGVPCTIIVPVRAAETKLAAIRRLGAHVVETSYDSWWQTFLSHEFEGQDGLFVHPFADPAVMAGNGTIGLEILEDLPDLDAVVVPWGGGGLCCGIASALRALKPSVRVYACEVETAAPLSASLAAGSPQRVHRIHSFVDGIGGVAVLPEMWTLASQLLDGSIVVTLREVVDAIRLLADHDLGLALARCFHHRLPIYQ